MPRNGSRVIGLRLISALACGLIILTGVTLYASAQTPGNTAFQRTWERTDKPVADLKVNRTWMWGDQAFTGEIREQYAQAGGGSRVVQYFDKSRMEINHDSSIPEDSPWRVTNGLLVRELVTGQMQIGDNTFEDRGPAAVNVAGDQNDATGVTYETIAAVLNATPVADGSVIVQRLGRGGSVTYEEGLVDHNVTAAFRVQLPGIDHQVASVFWSFMNSEDMVYENGNYDTAPLFLNPFYATGYPISEAYWSRVLLAGVPTDVLIQCFERRCLTYTPSNPDGWKVEAGNVGRHYHAWRYSNPSGSVTPTATPTLTNIPTQTPTTVGSSYSGLTIVNVIPAAADDPGANYEQVWLQNTTNFTIRADGWSIENQQGDRYTFQPVDVPVGYQLVLQSCKGQDASGDGLIMQFLNRCRPFVNRDGDRLALWNAYGDFISSYEVKGSEPTPTPTQTPLPTATKTPTPQPTATYTPTAPLPTATPYVEPLSYWYLDPEAAAFRAIKELCECEPSLSSRFVETMVAESWVLRHMYNLATADVGQFNADTSGYYEWQKEYIRMMQVPGGGETYFIDINTRVEDQMNAAIYDRNSPIGIKVRLIEAGLDRQFIDLGITGTEVYWYYLISPTVNHTRVADRYREAARSMFERIEMDYRVDTTFLDDFGDYLAYREFRLF